MKRKQDQSEGSKESQVPATKKAKVTTPPTTFLSLPREIRQAILLDVLDRSRPFRWYVGHDRVDGAGDSLKGCRRGCWIRTFMTVLRMAKAVKQAEHKLQDDVDWAWKKVLDRRSKDPPMELSGSWAYHWDSSSPNLCTAPVYGYCYGCPHHVQSS
ncbi:hypothetical protein EG328_001241 [Venturia inaequalis]|uniref:Uncharacterized protein n=1 Tax=Venturia inaequalis TaxID=5025 RepID=A0A8H3UYN7_VENIN|nr:hypothetical protein EG328_001241 [Venturia inaequalis]